MKKIEMYLTYPYQRFSALWSMTLGKLSGICSAGEGRAAPPHQHPLLLSRRMVTFIEVHACSLLVTQPRNEVSSALVRSTSSARHQCLYLITSQPLASYRLAAYATAPIWKSLIMTSSNATPVSPMMYYCFHRWRSCSRRSCDDNVTQSTLSPL